MHIIIGCPNDDSVSRRTSVDLAGVPTRVDLRICMEPVQGKATLFDRTHPR